jgi:hypothetical protein
MGMATSVSAVYYTLGIVLVVGGLSDVFLTVLHYDASGLVAARSYRLAWRGVRAVTGPLPERPRALLRSMAAPFMVAGTIGGWLGIQLLGFALLYLPGVLAGHQFVSGRMQLGFWYAAYFSAATLTSLSFSDAEPTGIGYHWLSAIETLVGLGILTLAVSYLLGLYRVLQDQGELADRLQHSSSCSNDPRQLLLPHFHHGKEEGLSTMVRDLHQNLIAHYEGMFRYPIVYYFHTRRLNRSIPYIFWFVGASAAALRWGLPETHPATANPWLPALIDGFDDMTRRVQKQFLPPAADGTSQTASFVEFLTARGGGQCQDERLSAFLELESFMRDLAELPGSTDGKETEEAYHRYQEWARFTSRGRLFVQAASRDLGLDPEDLYRDASRSLF